MDRSLLEQLNDNQVYLGINPLEVHLLDPFSDPDAKPSAGFYTDFSGVKKRLSYFGLPSGELDEKVGKIPFPDDGVHAEVIEYIAAIRAVSAARHAFTAVELGAGYGPWLTFSAKAAQKSGIEKINLIAVEADLERHALLRTHLSDNGLPAPDQSAITRRDGVSVELFYGAISESNGLLSFGSKSILDWGAAPITDEGNIDYRGYAVETQSVNAYTIEHVIQNVETVDFMHIDIQGFEYRSIKASIDAIRRKVRFLLVATHSRKIEGELFDLLYGNGWRILHEKPCKFKAEEASSLEALTNLDGTQVWVNTDLVAPEDYEINENIIRLKVAEYRAWALENAIKEKEEAIWRLEAENARLREDLARVRASVSWRITSPLRRTRKDITNLENRQSE